MNSIVPVFLFILFVVVSANEICRLLVFNDLEDELRGISVTLLMLKQIVAF